MNRQTKIILASASPRRKEILEKLDFNFEIMPCPKEEPPVLTLRDCILGAEFKAKTVAEGLGERGALVLGSDTVVCLGDKILGKPKNPEEAISMLKSLSGKIHIVASSIALVSKNGGELKVKSDIEKTEIKFRELSDEETKRYVASGECMDKAGAYAIQEGISSTFIESINGCYNNVVGLPVGLLLRLLSPAPSKLS